MAKIPFTSNYTDLSSQRGYQFKFFCRKCGNGYMSTFEPNRLGGVAAAANAAASLFGGIFSRAAQSAAALQTQVAGPQHDAALDVAVRGKFCPECGASVSQKRKCAHCGAEADGTPKFCPECGKGFAA
jgi:membrane protease subunit (stomatin/prohibitin family)